MKGVFVLSKERLTETFDKYNQCNDKNCKLSYCDRNCEHYQRMIDKLAEYESLEEQGLLLRLPVAVGQTLYTNQRKTGWYFRLKDAPYRVQVGYIGISNSTEMGGGFFNVSYEKHDCMIQFNFSDIGKIVFLTQSEAEEKLRELEKNYD